LAPGTKRREVSGMLATAVSENSTIKLFPGLSLLQATYFDPRTNGQKRLSLWRELLLPLLHSKIHFVDLIG
jgi:hypothetical protein